MAAFKIKRSDIVKVEYTGVAELLEPIVYRDGKGFACLYGANPKVGVIGKGATSESALSNWDARLKKHLATAGPGDAIVKKVKAFIADNTPIPAHVQAFYDQFRPVKRNVK